MAQHQETRDFLLLFSRLNRDKREGIRCRNARRRLVLYRRRRRHISSLFFMIFSHYLSLSNLMLPRVWASPRSQSFWEQTCEEWSDRQWIENLRMSRESFDHLAQQLSPHIKKTDTNFRKAIPARQRLAITLYWLSDNAHYRTIANLFGVGKSTVCGIVKDVCQAIVRVLLPLYIRLPQSPQEIQRIIDGFADRAGFPQVVGAVDGCHIPIQAPKTSPEDYVNRKDFHSILLQALVDCNYLFLDICVGWPGKVHDSRVFKNSPLFNACCVRSFLPVNMTQMISGVRIPPLILGDSAYGLQDWLMRPFTDRGNLSRSDVKFNNTHSMTRVVVENAFGRLKARFRVLGKKIDLQVENCGNIVAASCVLHNYCEIMHDYFDDQWLNGVVPVVFHPGNLQQDGQQRNAIAIREAIKNYL